MSTRTLGCSRALGRPAECVQVAPVAAAPAPIRTEERHGVLYVLSRDGIAHPVSSPRMAEIHGNALRRLGLA